MSLPRSLSAFVFLAASACGQSSGGARPPSPATAEQPSKTYAVVHPERGTLHRSVRQPGHVQAFERTPIVAKIAGYVQKWNADIGDRVRKGDVLAELWVPELMAELRQKEAQVRQAEKALAMADAQIATAKAQVQEAEAGLGRAEATRSYWQGQSERFARLAKTGVSDKQNQEEALDQYRSASAAYREAQAKVATARSNQTEKEAARDKADADVHAARADRERVVALAGYARFTSPYDGVVSQRNIDTQQFVQPAVGVKGDVLYVVERTDQVRVFVTVPEADADWVTPGAAAKVRVQVLPDQDFTGRVTRTAWSLDQTTRTLLSEIDLPNGDGRLRPGMYATVTIAAERPGALSLPASAVVTEGDVTSGYRSYFFEVADGHARRLPVQLGLVGNDRVEVLKKQVPGAKSGEPPRWAEFTGREEVIKSDAAGLKDGQAVTVGQTK